jgi:F-type H+-transporting ATPase subunit a
MNFNIDAIYYYESKMPELGFLSEYLPEHIRIPATIGNTWIVMIVLAIVTRLATRTIKDTDNFSRWQNLMEVLVTGMRDQIRVISGQDPKRFLPFIGTMFLFILASNLMGIIPGFIPPTASLSTTGSFGICVFFAVPIYGISSVGFGKYFKQYIEPVAIMLPLNIIGEFSRILSLSIRLYGNILSGVVIGMILLGLVPFFVPVIMQLLGIIAGVIHAYIFPVLAMVYIASALEASKSQEIFDDSGLAAEILPEEKLAA